MILENPARFLETVDDLVHAEYQGDLEAAAIAEMEAARHTRNAATAYLEVVE